MTESPAQIVASSPSWTAREDAAHQEIGRRSNLHITTTLRKLTNGRFWRKPDDPKFVSDRAQELAEVLLTFISPIESVDDVSYLVAGISGGPSNYNREGADDHTKWAADLLSLCIDVFGRTGAAFIGDAHTSRSAKLKGLGMAVRQLSPGTDKGAGENHLVIATITYLQALRSVRESALG